MIEHTERGVTESEFKVFLPFSKTAGRCAAKMRFASKTQRVDHRSGLREKTFLAYENPSLLLHGPQLSFRAALVRELFLNTSLPDEVLCPPLLIHVNMRTPIHVNEHHELLRWNGEASAKLRPEWNRRVISLFHPLETKDETS